jgi:hypothetical protein
VYVYVLVPSHVTGFGASVITGAPGVKVVPHASVTVGNVIPVPFAADSQFTVLAPGAAVIVNAGTTIVYTCDHIAVLPAQSVYVYVYVLVPSHVTGFGASVITGALGVSVVPHASVTVGNVIPVPFAADSQLTGLAPFAGVVNVGTTIV